MKKPNDKALYIINRANDFIKAHTKSTILILFLIFLLLLVLPICTRNYVQIDKDYYSKNEVALYIYKYNDLPSNFLTKNNVSSRGWSDAETLNRGYNYGGDTFNYLGAITRYTNEISLKEADIYPDREKRVAQNNRGKCRLVFTYNTNSIEVFYTEDHYESFDRVSLWEIQKISNILWIIFTIYILLVCAGYITIRSVIIKTNK